MATEFKWNKQRELAARFISEDEISDAEIAEKIGTSHRQLARWKLLPAFQARVDEHVAAWKARIIERGLAIRERRLQSLMGMADRIELIAKERGVELDGEAAGGSSGLICKDYKGKDADQPVYAFDAALVREHRLTLEAIAKEVSPAAKAEDLGGSVTINFTLASAAISEHLSASREYRRGSLTVMPESRSLVARAEESGDNGTTGPAAA